MAYSCNLNLQVSHGLQLQSLTCRFVMAYSCNP